MQVHFSQVRGLVSLCVILADVRVDQYGTGSYAGSGRPWQTRGSVLASFDLDFTNHWQYSDGQQGESEKNPGSMLARSCFTSVAEVCMLVKSKLALCEWVGE